MNAVHERRDEDQSGVARLVLDLPELEEHYALVLLDDAYGHRDGDQRHDNKYNDHIDRDHGLAFLTAAMVAGVAVM